jgi:hypothetical protein
LNRPFRFRRLRNRVLSPDHTTIRLRINVLCDEATTTIYNQKKSQGCRPSAGTCPKLASRVGTVWLAGIGHGNQDWIAQNMVWRRLRRFTFWDGMGSCRAERCTYGLAFRDLRLIPPKSILRDHSDGDENLVAWNRGGVGRAWDFCWGMKTSLETDGRDFFFVHSNMICHFSSSVGRHALD